MNTEMPVPEPVELTRDQMIAYCRQEAIELAQMENDEAGVYSAAAFLQKCNAANKAALLSLGQIMLYHRKLVQRAAAYQMLLSIILREAPDAGPEL